PFPGAGADQRDDVLAPGQHPGDGDLRDGDALGRGHLAQRLDEGEVVPQVVALEAGRVGPEVVGGERPAGGEVAGDQTAGEDAVGGDGDAEFAGGRQDLVLDGPGEERVLDLEVRDGRGGGGPADGVGVDLAEADVPYVALLDEFGDGADGLLDRDVRVGAGDPVDVDVVDAEALERVGGEVLHRGRAAVDPAPVAVRVAQGAELDAEQGLFAPGGGSGAQGLADQQLVVAHGVEVAGVEQGDAGLQGGVHGGDALGPVRVPVERGHAHAAEAEGEDPGAGGSQCAGVCRRHAVQPGMTNDRFQYLSFLNLSARRARTPGPTRARKRRTPGPGSPGPGVLAGREPSGAD